jgi:hypothetical protein
LPVIGQRYAGQSRFPTLYKAEARRTTVLPVRASNGRHYRIEACEGHRPLTPVEDSTVA